MAILEILTRCYKRPKMLAVNQAALKRQTNPDWIQTLLIDEIGRGVGWSYCNMAAYAPSLLGDYIWILDDDDVCILDTLVDDVGKFARQDPDIIFVRMDHGSHRILPNHNWGKSPVMGDIGCSAYIVRREIWQAHNTAFTNSYISDFHFVKHIYAHTQTHIWYDVVASAVQRISVGAPE